MPNRRWKTITVSEESYDKFEAIFKRLKEKGNLPLGVTTFSGYVTYKLTKQMQEEVLLKNMALKIKKIPEEFLETQTKLKPVQEIVQS